MPDCRQYFDYLRAMTPITCRRLYDAALLAALSSATMIRQHFMLRR